MAILSIYPLLFGLVFLINIIPAFMPPTWTVLAFFYIHYHLAFVPTVLVGVFAATAGRAILALMARYIFKPLLPRKWFGNYHALGKYLQTHQKLTVPVVLGYAFSPISSNSLFIVAGFTEMDLKIILFSFFVGRLFSYSFWILTSHALVARLDQLHLGTRTDRELLGIAVSILVIVLVGKIKWEKILK